MIRTVLVPLDGSKAAEAVIPYVELIASRTGAAVHFLTVVHEDTGEGRGGGAHAPPAHTLPPPCPSPPPAPGRTVRRRWSTGSSSRWTGRSYRSVSSHTWRSWPRRSAPASSFTTPSFPWISTPARSGR